MLSAHMGSGKKARSGVLEMIAAGGRHGNSTCPGLRALPYPDGALSYLLLSVSVCLFLLELALAPHTTQRVGH